MSNTTAPPTTFKMAYWGRLYANGIAPETVAPIYGSPRMYHIKLHNPETVQFGQLMLFAAAMNETPLSLYREYGVGQETLSEAEVRVLELLEVFINQNRQDYEQTLGQIRAFATDENAGAGAAKDAGTALATG